MGMPWFSEPKAPQLAWPYQLTFGSATAEYSFLLESATGSTETVGRYSFIGASEFSHENSILFLV